MTQLPMTQEAWLETPGCCPYCGRSAVDGGIDYGCLTVHDGSADQKASCGKCGRVWYETYTLTSYEPQEV